MEIYVDMEVSGLLVNWDRLKEIWHWENDSEPDWFALADDDDCDWVHHPASDLDDSDVENGEIGWLFLGIRDELPEATGDALGRFLIGFSMTVREDDEDEEFEVPDSLGLGFDIDTAIATNVSPDGIRELLDEYDLIDIDAVSAASKDYLSENETGLESDSAMEHFLAMWAGVLREANEKSLGLLVFHGG